MALQVLPEPLELLDRKVQLVKTGTMVLLGLLELLAL